MSKENLLKFMVQEISKYGVESPEYCEDAFSDENALNNWLLALADESSDLIKACIKLVRINGFGIPTDTDQSKAKDDLIEEMCDVIASMNNVLHSLEDDDYYDNMKTLAGDLAIEKPKQFMLQASKKRIKPYIEEYRAVYMRMISENSDYKYSSLDDLRKMFEEIAITSLGISELDAYVLFNEVIKSKTIVVEKKRQNPKKGSVKSYEDVGLSKEEFDKYYSIVKRCKENYDNDQETLISLKAAIQHDHYNDYSLRRINEIAEGIIATYKIYKT